MDINIEKIVSDACAHAQIELTARLDSRMEPQNRKYDIWMTDWYEESKTAIPASISVALNHALSDLFAQLNGSEKL